MDLNRNFPFLWRFDRHFAPDTVQSTFNPADYETYVGPRAASEPETRNVIWLLVAGIWIAIGHVATAIAMAVTIIGIPLAIANLKLIPVSLMPLGKQIVPSNTPFVQAYR